MQSPSGIATRGYAPLEYLPTIGQPYLGSIWDSSIGGNPSTNDEISINSPCKPPPRNLNNLVTIHVRKPGPPLSRSIPTCILINARSLAKPEACPSLYLELNTHNVDVAIVSETWLKLNLPFLVKRYALTVLQ